MKKLSLSIIVILIALGLNSLTHSPREMIVKLKDAKASFDIATLPQMNTWLGTYGITKIAPLTNKENSLFYLIETQEDIPLEEIEAKHKYFANIDYIQANYLNTFHANVNDPYYYQQQHDLCNIAQSWAYTRGDEDLIIAVIDSGILYDHPDLGNSIYNNEQEVANSGLDDDNNGYIDDYRGWDFTDAPTLSNIALGDYIDRDNDASDETYHGSHVSGIIGAQVNNQEGIAGVMWHLQIMPLRAGFRTSTGSGYLQDDDVASAIIYASDMGAKIINMSWGSDYYSPIIADACQYAYERGVILVASAGNDSQPYLSYPAKLANVISVGSIDPTKILSSFSNYGPDLDVVAPGSQIISTYNYADNNSGYFELSGTSMATPHVTGILGLLLSQRPGLTFPEIRALLHNTSYKLPENSSSSEDFNIYYGYGLVDAFELLSSSVNQAISISFPYEEMATGDGFEISGRIDIEDFFRYSVTYSSGSEIEDITWKDCSTHQNRPHYYTSNDIDLPYQGFLHNFNVIPELADGLYRLRLRVQTNSGENYDIFRNIYLDKTIPNLTQDIELLTRYESSKPSYYLNCHFNEAVDVQVSIYPSNNQQYQAYSIVSDTLHFIKLPSDLPNGEIDVEISAHNRSGLVFNSGLISAIGEIDVTSTPINYFGVNDLFPFQIIPVQKNVDFDQNGKNEFIAMEVENASYGRVAIYEQNISNFAIKHEFNDKFRPLDIKTNGDRPSEIVGLNLESLYIYEIPQSSNYPLDVYTQAISNGAGAIFADTNNNNEDELVAVINEPDQTVIRIYSKIGNEYLEDITLTNPTPTSTRNSFVPGIKCGDLDGDNYPDILTADSDGDLIIFEPTHNADNSLAWTSRLEVKNTYYLEIGDFTGDGENEFIVGGYNEELENFNNTYFKFYLFKAKEDNSYEILDTISFNNVQRNNSLLAYDYNQDGKDEIYLSLTPNLYKLEVVENQLIPVAVQNSDNSFQISFYQADSATSPLLLCNQTREDEEVSVYLTERDFDSEPQTPANFQVVPLDQQSVSLTWQADGLSTYNIYRNEVSPELIGTTSEGFFADRNLTCGLEYTYAISTYNENYPNPESFLTAWQAVTPNQSPDLLNIRKLSDLTIELVFNVALANQMNQVGHYFLDQGIGFPKSVILDSQNTRALLHLRKPLSEATYELTCTQVVSRDNISVALISRSFSNSTDLLAPQVESIVISGDKSVILTFTEAVFAPGFLPLERSNFRLKNPPFDSQNEINYISHDEDQVRVIFKEKLHYGNYPYKLILKGIIDSNANEILAQFSSIHFNLTDITDLSKLVVYPNPVYSRSGDNEIYFTNFPLNCKGNISIYNKAGDLVFTQSVGPYQGIENFRWDLKNSQGHKVSSGVYFYVIKMGENEKKGKIAILN